VPIDKPARTGRRGPPAESAPPLARRHFLRLGAVALAAGLMPARLRAAAAAERATGARPAVPAPIAEQGYRLVKDWDFARTVTTPAELHREFATRFKNNGGKLDTLNDEWQRYRDNDNHRLEDGVLKLVAHAPGGLRNGGIESGLIRSHWTGKYGYFESKVKPPAGKGMWSAFWLVPDDLLWPPEIDIFEIVDNGRDTTRRSFHGVALGKIPVRTVFSRLDRWGAYAPPFDYQDGFHLIAAEWTPRGSRHFVDDELVVEREFEWRHENGSDAGPAHVLANLAVGGRWPGPPQSMRQFPAVFEIAHIRIWQK
jgi:beta-glucanase (GH16 family)